MERTFHMLLYRAFHAQRNQLRPCIGRIGLEVGQPKILTYLAKNGPCPQKQLAGYFEVDSAAVSRMLDSLEKGGFITRRLSAHSRRSNLVELTEKGRQAYAVWQDCCGELEERMLARLHTTGARSLCRIPVARLPKFTCQKRGGS